MSTRGIRLSDVKRGDLPSGLDTKSICYWKDENGLWWLYLPAGGIGRLEDHTVTEHEDGTITVSPSILLTSPGNPNRHRHGFLNRGTWEPCGDDRPL